MNDTRGALLPALNWGDPVDADGDFLLPVGTVTLLLADVEGSTRRWEEAESETADAMSALSDVVSEAIGRHHGVRPLEQGEGDSFVAAFARASEAVACALAIQRALAAGPLSVRIGVHSGEAQRRADKTYVGPAVNRTARLRDAAHGGQIVLSQATAELVAERLPDHATLTDLGRHRLRDLARPEHVFQLRHPDVRSEFPPLRSLDTFHHNLPEQRTTLFGRHREADEVESLLTSGRLVTLTGGGGCGKTRLGLHVASRRLDEYADGVFFVDLSTIRDATLGGGAVTAALGLGPDPETVLVPYLRDKALLLVLDNCEHVVGACARLADTLLSTSSKLRVLATSREPLGVSDETTYRVPSLDVPPEDAAVAEGLSGYAALELFVDRARHARADFEPTDGDMAAIARICRRLDGVPLAIALAAARVRAMTPAEIAEALGERFRILTGGSRTALPRQQTLKASVDWSHDLLTEPERVAFRRLAVFAGSFTLDAARDVCAANGIERHQVIDLMTLLVDKSLVVVVTDGGRSRYRLLETIREYAVGRLSDADETVHRQQRVVRIEQARLRHRDHYLAVADRYAAMFLTFEISDALLDDFVGELSNLRAAFDLTQERRDAETMARFGVGTIAALILLSPNEVSRRFDWVARSVDELAPDLRLDFACAWWLLRMQGPLSDETWRADHADYLAAGDEIRCARAVAVCASTLRTDLGLDGAIAATLEALSTARRQGDRLGMYLLLYKAVTGSEWTIPNRDSSGYWDELVDLVLGVGCSMLTFMTLSNRAGSAERHGKYRSAMDTIDRLGQPPLKTIFGQMALFSRCTSLAKLGDLDDAETAGIDALRMASELGYDEGAGVAHVRLAQVRALRGDPRGAIDHSRTAIDLLTRAASHAPNARAHLELAGAQLALGDIDAAARTAEAGVSVPAWGAWAKAFVTIARAAVARARSDLAGSEQLAHDALPGSAAFHMTNSVATCLELIAGAAVEQESYTEGARLFGATDALRETNGDLMRSAPFDAWYADDLARVRGALDADAFGQAWDEGAAMSWRDAAAYAQRGRGERKRPSSGWASLTPTERQVADLVAEGLSNQHIAKRLVISARTVGSHLTHIYAKLGVRTRTALSAEAHRRAAR